MSRAGAGVADLADKLQDHACQGDAAPIWARPGSHLSSGLVREIAVWRAANGINRQDPRPTGGTQLETLPALWKQRLDRDVARATDPPAMQGATSDRQQAPHQAVTTTADARTKDPNSVRAGRPPPADSTPRSSDCGARNPCGCRPRGDDRTPSDCRIWLFHIKRRVSSLRCGPRRRSFATMLLIRCHDFARPDPCRVD